MFARRILLVGGLLAAFPGSGIAIPVDQQDSLSGARPYRPLDNYRAAAGALLDKQNMFVFVVSSAAFLGARGLDERTRDANVDQGRLGSLDHLGNDVFGTGVPGILIGAGTWLYGDAKSSSFAMHAGQAHLEALLSTTLATSALKHSVHRRRPDGSDDLSFPSGHTSTVAASATVLSEFYGWKAGVPAFAIVVLTAASRISSNKHWLSDTVGGATLGLLFGHASARAHLNRLSGSTQTPVVLVTPTQIDGVPALLLTFNI